MNKYVLGICTLNEAGKIDQVVKRFCDYALYDLIILDDGSTDGAVEALPRNPHIHYLRNSRNMGAGYGVRRILSYAKEKGYEAVFFVAGNNKDSPDDIYKLKQAMAEGFDLVQGSRYLKGGSYGRMPFYRLIATRLVHPLLFSMITGRRITDSTNGFRAVRLSILDDARIALDQDWLEHYELEPYLFYKVITLGYRYKEVPVTKIYPPKTQGYTKMKPITGWWSILRPLVYLGLGIKK
jgi:dolichol-phosphate mannosyltransferase